MTTFSRMLTNACMLLVVGCGSDSLSGWLVVMRSCTRIYVTFNVTRENIHRSLLSIGVALFNYNSGGFDRS